MWPVNLTAYLVVLSHLVSHLYIIFSLSWATLNELFLELLFDEVADDTIWLFILCVCFLCMMDRGELVSLCARPRLWGRFVADLSADLLFGVLALIAGCWLFSQLSSEVSLSEGADCFFTGEPIGLTVGSTTNQILVECNIDHSFCVQKYNCFL